MMRFAFVFSLGLVAVATTAFSSDWTVAADGDDSWSGKLLAPNAAQTDGPFATLGHARNAVRAAKQAGDVSGTTVQVRSGLYELPTGLKLEAQDSGTAAAPTVWRAFANEKGTLIGGHAITTS